MEVVFQNQVWLRGVGEEKTFPLPSMCSNWDLLVTDKNRLTGEKGIHILFDINILFMCMEACMDKK